MPGEHIDKIYNAAIDRFNYVALTTEQLKTATESEKELDRQRKDVSVGSQVFDSIERSDLKPEEKQEVYLKLAQKGVIDEVEATKKAPNNLLRTDSKVSNFISAYMKQYASSYQTAVRDQALEGAIALSENTSLSIEEKQLMVAKQIIKAGEGNLDKLTPEVRTFLKSTLSPVTSPEVMNQAVVGTLNLRGTNSAIFDMGVALKESPETKQVGDLLFDANNVSMSYLNRVNADLGSELGGKKWDQLAKQLRDKESVDNTKKMVTAITKGDESIDEVAVNNKLTPADDGLLRKMEQFRLAAKINGEMSSAKRSPTLGPIIKAGEDHLKALETKKNQLTQNPTFGDKFKAFFKHGLKGVDGEVAKINQEIQATKVAIKETATGITISDRQEYLKNLQEGFDRLKGEIVIANLDNSMGQGTDQAKLGQNIKTGVEVEDKLKQEMQVLTVRQKLEQQVSEKQGASVKVQQTPGKIKM